jgi:hypothetical protein
MKRISRRLIRGIALGGFVAALAACNATPPPEDRVVLSYDGLTPIEDTLMTQVWVREGFTLAGYDKVMLIGADIQYRPLQQTAETGNGSDFPITEAQKENFEALISEEFDKALERLTLPEVTEPGPDVLLVRGTMLDVVSRVPPPGSEQTGHRLDSVGQATFVVELIDSQSNAVLVRALDIRAAAIPGQADSSDQITRDAAVRQLIARWASMLVDALNDLTAVDNLQGT